MGRSVTTGSTGRGARVTGSFPTCDSDGEKPELHREYSGWTGAGEGRVLARAVGGSIPPLPGGAGSFQSISTANTEPSITSHLPDDLLTLTWSKRWWLLGTCYGETWKKKWCSKVDRKILKFNFKLAFLPGYQTSAAEPQEEWWETPPGPWKMFG